jgi:hypothetical protein
MNRMVRENPAKPFVCISHPALFILSILSILSDFFSLDSEPRPDARDDCQLTGVDTEPPR